jgi:lariat debranching enzyme
MLDLGAGPPTATTNAADALRMFPFYDESTYHAGRPPIDAIHKTSRKAYIGFTEDEVQRAAELGPADVLLIHEWPEGIAEAPSLPELARMQRTVSYRQIGNAKARMLIELLQPKIVCCGHMHERRRAEIAVGSTRIPVFCLASLHEGKEAIAVFEQRDDRGLREIGP